MLRAAAVKTVPEYSARRAVEWRGKACGSVKTLAADSLLPVKLALASALVSLPTSFCKISNALPAPPLAAAGAARQSELSWISQSDLTDLPPELADLPGMAASVANSLGLACVTDALSDSRFPDKDCILPLFSKVLGYAIIVSSTIVKLPQVLSFTGCLISGIQELALRSWPSWAEQWCSLSLTL